MPKTVGLAGLGAIGGVIARNLLEGMPGLELIAVASAEREKSEEFLNQFPKRPPLTPLDDLADADIVIEALPAAIFDRIAGSAVAAGRIFVPCSVGALLSRPRLFETAKLTGARIVVPTGAIAGLDAVRALARTEIRESLLESRKPPRGLAGAPYLTERNISVEGLAEPKMVFEGNAAEACLHFPANANVAAALALAGVGPDRTRVQIWADPHIDRNVHKIKVDAAGGRLSIAVENVPSADNPRTSQLAALSILACLAGLVDPVKIGS